MYRSWTCEGCGFGQRFRENIFNCPGCGAEGCDNCFWMFAHCKACCVGKTEEELRLRANADGWDFDELPVDRKDRPAVKEPS